MCLGKSTGLHWGACPSRPGLGCSGVIEWVGASRVGDTRPGYADCHLLAVQFTLFSPAVFQDGQRNLHSSVSLLICLDTPMGIPVLCSVTRSCLTLCSPMDCSRTGSSVHGDSPDKNTRVGYHALLQRIFPTQGSNPGLLHCRRILCHLSHQGSLWPFLRVGKAVSDVWDSDSNPAHPCELGQLLSFCASLSWCRDMISFSLGVYLGRSTFTFYLQLHWVFIAWHGLSLVAASRGSPPVAVLGLLTAGASQLWHMGLVYPEACGIFLDQGSNQCRLHWQADS